MRIISALSELKDVILSYRKNSQTIGFVPTMGALHKGHIALIGNSTEQNEVTVVSIFVNPLQFNNASDLALYPRVVEEDIELLKTYKVDVVFIPEEDEFYPEKPSISVDFGELANRLEGKFRQGHFEGVGVVVSKLLHLTNPDRAYFGLKDLQQFLLIKRMCQELNFPCEVVGVETVREESGLALSSRNRRLTENGQKVASTIFKGLQSIQLGIEEGKSLNKLLQETEKRYQGEEGFDLEYLEAVDTKELLPVNNYSSLHELAICVAGYVEGVRLIDNLYLRLK
ncbi:pantoate--beta-alanine ligase [Ekhidna sp.]|uniref:pantoate--beta-alanine ligase n=1 Tax=Ekhidna sp. TaxID=2608089 RepID=UPI003B596641